MRPGIYVRARLFILKRRAAVPQLTQNQYEFSTPSTPAPSNTLDGSDADLTVVPGATRYSSAKRVREPVDMFSTCKYADRMPVMVQIRNVPSDLHRELKARAALEGMSLSDYLLRELRHALDRPTLDEIPKQLSSRQPVRPHPAPAAAVRREEEPLIIVDPSAANCASK